MKELYSRVYVATCGEVCRTYEQGLTHEALCPTCNQLSQRSAWEDVLECADAVVITAGSYCAGGAACDLSLEEQLEAMRMAADALQDALEVYRNERKGMASHNS